MAWADEIAEQNAILASNQKNLDWLQGNTATFHTGSSEEPIERTAAGAVGYMTAWRTDNPSVTEGDLFTKWNYWVNDVTIEGDDAPSKTVAEAITAIQEGMALITADRDALQAHIDNGDVDAGE
jgi:hypothetical protein